MLQASLSLTLIHDNSLCIFSMLFLKEQCRANLAALFWVNWILFSSCLDAFDQIVGQQSRCDKTRVSLLWLQCSLNTGPVSRVVVPVGRLDTKTWKVRAQVNTGFPLSTMKMMRLFVWSFVYLNKRRKSIYRISLSGTTKPNNDAKSQLILNFTTGFTRWGHNSNVVLSFLLLL